MPGFFICNRLSDYKLNNINENRCVSGSLYNEKYIVMRNTLDKFLDDKLFSEDMDCIIITDGVFLNKTLLCSEYNSSWFETVKTMALADETGYFDRFRGNFSGAHYNKKKDIWVAYTDPFGNKPLFYYFSDGLFILASDLLYITDALKQLNIRYTVDTSAIYDILTYGFMITDRTLVKEIKKLPYGSYLTFDGSKLAINRYYDFDYCDDYKNNDIQDEEIIERLDALFKEAVKLEYEKDKEYGYKHIATLSGGLDSRMNVWVANSLGYDNMLNITFGEADCMDVTIAKEVSEKLGTELVIRNLNDGKMLSAFDKVIKMNFGLTLYSGIAHTLGILENINAHYYGLLHTGDLGDVIVGSYEHKSERNHPGAYSIKLADKLTNTWDGVKNIEKFKMITRGFNGVITSKIVCENYFYCISPFLYRDFFEYCIKEIPPNKRKEHYIYKKWVLAKYPDVAKIPLQRFNGGLLSEGKILQLIRKIKRIGIKTCVNWAMWKLHISKELKRITVNSSMNPMDKWYSQKEKIRLIMDSYFEKEISRISSVQLITSEINKDLNWLYKNGTTIEKTQVLTVLRAIDILFF